MKRNFKFLFTLVIIVSCMIFSSVSVFAEAKIGEELLQPEEGWKRYDDHDENIYYKNGYSFKENSNHYKGTAMYNLHRHEPMKVKFKFTGKKIAIIGVRDLMGTSDATITIDGITYDMANLEGSHQGNWVAFLKEDLTNTLHSVTITHKSYHLLMDAIDIDENGQLLPFDYVDNTEKVILDAEPEKEKIRVNEEVYADLTIDNIKEIAAEDIRIKYDNEKLKFIDFEEADGTKLVKDIRVEENGELRVILASKGKSNIVNDKKALLRLNFKGIKPGEAKVDITKGRVSDGIEMEKDLTEEQCDEGIIIIEAMTDVNNSGEFTLLDLGIDARHLSKDPKSEELSKYNTDIATNDAIDEYDLLEIGKLMIDNPNYEPNSY